MQVCTAYAPFDLKAEGRRFDPAPADLLLSGTLPAAPPGRAGLDLRESGLPWRSQSHRDDAAPVRGRLDVPLPVVVDETAGLLDLLRWGQLTLWACSS